MLTGVPKSWSMTMSIPLTWAETSESRAVNDGRTCVPPHNRSGLGVETALQAAAGLQGPLPTEVVDLAAGLPAPRAAV